MPKRICSLLLGTILLLLAAACTPPEPIRIGFLGGLSGRVADLGIGGRNGATLAVEQRNQRGGIRNRRIELLTEDDQQNADTARKAVARLIAQNVSAIVGPMTSDMAMAVVPQLNAAKLPLLSPTVTTNALSGIDDYFFRVVGATRDYAQKSAQYHTGKAGLRRMAVLYDVQNRTYSEDWLGDYSAAFEAAGGHVINRIGFASSNELHFSELARAALKNQPDGVLIIANSVDAAMLAQKIRQLKPGMPLAAAEWASTEQLVELGGKAVEGIMIAQFIDRTNSSPSYLAFHKAYVERFGHEPGFAGVAGFDATNLILDALEAKAPEQTLKQVLLSGKSFVGVQSPIQLDAYGDGYRESHIGVVINGRFETIK